MGPTSDNPLLRPFACGKLALPNRLVMAPMTRGFSPDGVPGEDVARYYRRRAEGGVGLIVTEGVWIPHRAASNDPSVPRLYGPDALGGWARVVREVHEAGGRIVPQLWHIGAAPKSDVGEIYGDRPDAIIEPVSPSGLAGPGLSLGAPLSPRGMDEIFGAYVQAASNAQALGFDGVEIHGAHGYLLDQFFWDVTNRRTDRYGGSVANRARFAAEIVAAIRATVGPDFPILFRFSQWKLQDYAARPWPTPQDLEAFLEPLVLAGVDIFDCSQRRFWTPEYEGSALNLAGWTRKLSGRPTITVGSVSLDLDMTASVYEGQAARVTSLDRLYERLDRDEFDLVAVARALLADPDWLAKVASARWQDLTPYTNAVLKALD